MTYIQLAWKKSRSEVKIKAFSIYDKWRNNLKVVKKKHACIFCINNFVHQQAIDKC